MAINISSEKGDSRVRIRKETDNFLFGVKGQTSDYSPLELDDISEVLGGPGEIPEPYLTGVRSAVLPMVISIADRNNKRLEFTMLVNPESMNHGKTSSVYGSYTRNGYVNQLWGPNQDIIMSTGKTAAFMVAGDGLTHLGRRSPFAYGNFLALFYSYRNNGYQLLSPTALEKSLTRVINIIHGVEISYDGQIFMGHFNNFTIDEDATRPFLFNYNFEFVVSSLSETYHEIRGHFIPIGYKSKPKEPNLIKDIKETDINVLSPSVELYA